MNEAASFLLIILCRPGARVDAMPTLPSHALRCYIRGRVNRRAAWFMAWATAIGETARLVQCLNSTVEHD